MERLAIESNTQKTGGPTTPPSMFVPLCLLHTILFFINTSISLTRPEIIMPE